MYCSVQCTVVLIMYVISSMPSLSTLSLLSALEILPGITYPTVVHELLEKILHKGGSGTRNLLGIT